MSEYLHIVLLQFKSDCGSEKIAEIFRSLEALKGLIPGLLSFSGGAYESPEGLQKNYTHGFTMRFADRESRDAYFPHVEHEKVKDAILPLVDDVVAFDYAVPKA